MNVPAKWSVVCLCLGLLFSSLPAGPPGNIPDRPVSVLILLGEWFGDAYLPLQKEIESRGWPQKRAGIEGAYRGCYNKARDIELRSEIIISNLTDFTGYDALIIPSGPQYRKFNENPAVLDFVRRAHGAGLLVASFCTGNFVVKAAGLTDREPETGLFPTEVSRTGERVLLGPRGGGPPPGDGYLSAPIREICDAVARELGRSGQTQDEILIKLENRLYSDTSPTLGMMNIFFSKVEGSPETFPSDWNEIEEADLFRSSEFESVKVFRYRSAGAGFQYVVKTSDEPSWTGGPNLQFRPYVGGLIVADFMVDLRPKNTADAPPVKRPFQVILSAKEGYAYSRIGDYREGRIEINGTTDPVQLHHSGPGELSFDAGKSVCLIDRNHDGIFQLGTIIQKDGSLLESERVDIGGPFFLAGKPWRTGALAPDGNRWELVPATEKTAPAVGFQAPPLAFRDLRGRSGSLDQWKGKIVLIQFWSTDCPWSKNIRPDLNALIDGQNKDDFAALAAAFKSGNIPDIEAFLGRNPMSGTVIVADETVLNSYNAKSISPLFYLVDGRGLIRYIGFGATQVPILQKKIEALLGEK